MSHGNKKKLVREAPKNRPLGLAITLAAAAGVVIGSAGTYYFIPKPATASKPSGSAAAEGTPAAQTISMAPQQQFTPAPQPPGEAPPGKVWSVEHGHWHDAPVVTTPAATPANMTVTPAGAPVTVTPAAVTVTPAPASVTVAPPATTPPEKKE